MLKLTRRGKVEPLPLNADDANLAVIEARDEALADAVALRDRCDNLYAVSLAKDATIAEAEARGAEALELASLAEADATDLRERLAEVLGVRDAAVAAQSERADKAEAGLHDIDLILDGVPRLSQDHPGQAGPVAELAGRCKAAEAEAADLRKRVDDLEPFEPRTGGLSINADGSPVIDVRFPEEFARLMLGSFRWYLDDHKAANYVHMPMTDMGTGETYWVTIGRPGGKSPHELRVAADAQSARLSAELARVAAALAPLTVTTGMTHAERALAAGVIRDSISLPAPARPDGLTVRARQVDETVADPYQGLGSGGMIP
jgi:hypothetical protein